MVKKRIFAQIIALMMVAAFIVPVSTDNAFGMTKVSISGGENASVGETFTLSIKFSGDDMSSVEGQIGYDSSKLEYVSGGSDGSGYGYVALNKSGGRGSVSFDVTFRATRGGNTGIDVSSSAIYDYNKNPVDNCSDTRVIAISSAGEETTNKNVVDETTESTETTETTTEETTAVTSAAETTTTTTAAEEPDATKDSFGIGKVITVIIIALVVIIAALAAAASNKKRKRRKERRARRGR